MMIGTMEIDVLIDESVEGCPEPSWLQSIAKQVLIAQKISPDAELGLVITDQERVRQLNRDYREKDEPTDVLAFTMSATEEKPVADSPPFVVPPNGIRHLGEVIISYPQAIIQAKEQRHSIKGR